LAGMPVDDDGDTAGATEGARGALAGLLAGRSGQSYAGGHVRTWNSGWKGAYVLLRVTLGPRTGSPRHRLSPGLRPARSVEERDARLVAVRVENRLGEQFADAQHPQRRELPLRGNGYRICHRHFLDRRLAEPLGGGAAEQRVGRADVDV